MVFSWHVKRVWDIEGNSIVKRGKKMDEGVHETR